MFFTRGLLLFCQMPLEQSKLNITASNDKIGSNSILKGSVQSKTINVSVIVVTYCYFIMTLLPFRNFRGKNMKF